MKTKILKIIDKAIGISLLVVAMVSISALDSEKWWIPTIGMVVSIGLLSIIGYFKGYFRNEVS